MTPSELEVIRNWSTLAIAAVGGLLALFQFQRNQAWKSVEFLALQMKEFDNDPYVIATKQS